MALSATCVCYNHPEKRGDFKCFDCKPDSVVNLCPQCNIQVHSLDIFRAHKVERIESKGQERRLSQDVTDIEKLIDVENDILQNVLTRLRYTEGEEKEMQSQLIQLQTATKRRISEIRDCQAKIEKAINYLSKVSSMITHCSSPVNVSNTDMSQDAAKDPVVEHSEDSLKDPHEHTSEEPLLEPSEVLQKGPADRPIIELPDVLRGKDVFPVRVVGSLSRNGSFWISKISESDVESQRRLHSGIKTHFQKNGFGDKVDVKEGTLCAAFNRHVKEFCRVRIEKVLNPNTVRLCFVDLAMTEDAPLSVLCRLPKAFEDHPFQAVECCLFPDLDTKLPYEAKWCFKDLTYNKVLMAAIEGQVTASNGHAAQHVTLVSCGEFPECINSKVEATVEEQKLAKEDRPVQPKFEPDVRDTVTNEGVSSQREEIGIKGGTMAVDGVDSLEDKQHVAVPIKVIADNRNLGSRSGSPQNDDSTQRKLTLRVEAAEFIPISSESDRTPSQASSERKRNSVPGILHLPEHSRPAVTFPAPDRSHSGSPTPYLPVGCVDFATYTGILAKASLNLIAREELHKARFMLIRSDLKRIVEGMKYDIWCSSVHGNRRLNRVFNEQAIKGGGGPVFLLFSGTKRNYFCGVARMKTAVDPKGNCQLLNEPFRFGDKMVGRCEIEWIYTSDLYFDNVLTPDSGFRRNMLVDAGDCYEVPARLGQLILTIFDSDKYFSSILQEALEYHQPYFMADQPGNTEPLWIPPPEEQNSFVSMSQENWDEEIEASLRSARAAVPVQMDEKSPRQVETEQEEKEEKDPLKSPVDTSNSESTSPTEALSGSDQFDSVSSGGQINLAELNATLGLMSPESASEEMESYQSGTETGAPVYMQDQNQNPVMGAPFSAESGSSVPLILPDSQQVDVEQLEAKEVQDDMEAIDLSTSIENADASVSSGDLSDWETTSPTKICTSEDSDIQAITEAESTEISTATGATCKNVVNEPKSEDENGDNLQTCSAVSTDARTRENLPDTGLMSQNEAESFGVQSDALHEGETEGENVEQEGFSHAKDEDRPHSCLEFEAEQVAMMPVDSVSVEEPHSCDEAQTADEVEAVLIEDVSSKQGSVVTDLFCPQEGDRVEDQSEGGEALPSEDRDSSLSLPSEGRPSSPQASDLHSREGHYNSSEDLLDYSHSPVEEGKEYTLVALENVSSAGTFWARLFRNNEEESAFVHLMKQMGTSVEASNETLAADEVHIYKQCCFRGPDGYWHRGLVESLLDNGEILVRLIDLGECWEISIKELKPLSDDFYLALPPQAFECSIFYAKDNKKEKLRIHKLVKSNRKLRVLVKCFSSTTVEVEVLSSVRD